MFTSQWMFSSPKQVCLWRIYCYVRITIDGDNRITNTTGTHKHGVNTSTSVTMLKASCKRKATEELSLKPRSIIQCKLQSLGDDGVTVRDVNNVYQAMYRKRRKLLPTLPRTRPERIEAIQDIDCATNRQEDFLLHADDDMIIFTCPTNLHKLCEEVV